MRCVFGAHDCVNTVDKRVRQTMLNEAVESQDLCHAVYNTVSGEF